MKFILFCVVMPIAFVWLLHFVFTILPNWIAKREILRYWRSNKEDFAHDGGLMFEYMFKSNEYEVFVNKNKEKRPFQKKDKGRVMIRRIDGEHFFMDYLDVPIHIRMYWDTLISNND